MTIRYFFNRRSFTVYSFSQKFLSIFIFQSIRLKRFITSVFRDIFKQFFQHLTVSSALRHRIRIIQRNSAQRSESSDRHVRISYINIYSLCVNIVRFSFEKSCFASALRMRLRTGLSFVPFALVQTYVVRFDFDDVRRFPRQREGRL